VLIGQFCHSLDTKGRLIIPGKLRDDLGQSFVITRGLDNSLFLYPMEEWLRLKAEIDKLPLSTGRNLQRFFFSNAEEVEPDGQGRILIPAHLREYAKLSKEAVVIGASIRVEIYDKTVWEKQNSSLTNESIIAAMTEIGF
jgi:MraZ protein